MPTAIEGFLGNVAGHIFTQTAPIPSPPTYVEKPYVELVLEQLVIDTAMAVGTGGVLVGHGACGGLPPWPERDV